MTRHTFNHNGDTYIRVSRRQAKRLYSQGKEIIAVPCNLRPFTRWNNESTIQFDATLFTSFDSWVNSFEYYACRNNETGRYASFYVKGA